MSILISPIKIHKSYYVFYSQTIQTNYDKIRPFKISLTNVNCALDLLSLKDNAEILSDAFNMGSTGTIIHNITDEHVQNLNTPTNHLYSDYGKNIVTLRGVGYRFDK